MRLKLGSLCKLDEFQLSFGWIEMFHRKGAKDWKSGKQNNLYIIVHRVISITIGICVLQVNIDIIDTFLSAGRFCLWYLGLRGKIQPQSLWKDLICIAHFVPHIALGRTINPQHSSWDFWIPLPNCINITVKLWVIILVCKQWHCIPNLFTEPNSSFGNLSPTKSWLCKSVGWHKSKYGFI